MPLKIRTYESPFSFQFSGESYHDDYVIVVSYQVHPGSPETRIDPGSSPSVELLSVSLHREERDGLPRVQLDLPPWLEALVQDDEVIRDEILAHDADAEVSERADAEERRAEEAREETWSWRQGPR